MEINNAFGLDWTGDSGAAQRSERSEGAGSDEVLATLSATMQQQQPKPKLNKQINILNTLPKRIHAAHNSMFIYCCRRLCPSALQLFGSCELLFEFVLPMHLYLLLYLQLQPLLHLYLHLSPVCVCVCDCFCFCFCLPLPVKGSR